MLVGELLQWQLHPPSQCVAKCKYSKAQYKAKPVPLGTNQQGRLDAWAAHKPKTNHLFSCLDSWLQWAVKIQVYILEYSTPVYSISRRVHFSWHLHFFHVISLPQEISQTSFGVSNLSTKALARKHLCMKWYARRFWIIPSGFSWWYFVTTVKVAILKKCPDAQDCISHMFPLLWCPSKPPV